LRQLYLGIRDLRIGKFSIRFKAISFLKWLEYKPKKNEENSDGKDEVV